jgi:general secretion pathway protein J
MNRREAGYTLLEMLVALVVFGLVMAGLAQSWRFGLAAWSGSERHIAGPEDMAAVDTALRGMIARAVPGSMTGRPGGLAFTTHLPQGAGGLRGLADIAIQLGADGTLTLSATPHAAGIPLRPPPPPSFETLATGVDEVRVSYLTPQNGAPPAWGNKWTGTGLPLLVRIHLRFADGHDWPDLIAAPVNTGQ